MRDRRGDPDLALLPRDEGRSDRPALQPGAKRLRGRHRAIGNNVKIQNNVSVYDAVELEDDVFCGPSCVFTNVINPRSQIVRHSQYQRTLVRRGATIGANATIVCGATVGRYAFIAAGAVVRGDVPDYALMMGVPARQRGWMSRHGHRLANPDAEASCSAPRAAGATGRSSRACCAAWTGRRMSRCRR